MRRFSVRTCHVNMLFYCSCVCSRISGGPRLCSAVGPLLRKGSVKSINGLVPINWTICGQFRKGRDSCRHHRVGPSELHQLTHAVLFHSTCCVFLCFFFFRSSSPPALFFFKRSTSKPELGLMWGPQIDRVLQQGCGDLRWKRVAVVCAGIQRCIFLCAL